MEATLPPQEDMSNVPHLDAPAKRVSLGSVQTQTSRPLQPIPDPSASKRVCFYRSGDPKFHGHRVVINGRTFKSFDALLDALSKKVPLSFGVRTISTPRGTHSVRGLEDLHDGGSYVCSDQRRVKPLNLNAVHRRQVPWNATRPPSPGHRRRGGRRKEGGDYRATRTTERVKVQTPRRLVVVKNKDPAVKHTVVLQRRTAPTFDALLDYLSQVMQFPVLRLYSTDGRRVDGLAALILCSGVIVAAGNEVFRLRNYNVYKPTLSNYNVHQMAYKSPSAISDATEPLKLQPLAYNNKPNSNGRGSRNFSLSSERYMADQINRSLNGSIHQNHHNGSLDTDLNGSQTLRTQESPHTCILPQDGDIEKSFCVNQDGSMTVAMKVRLTIKEEELLQWTTTLSRGSLNHRTAFGSKSGTGDSLPDSNNSTAKDSSSVRDDAPKEHCNPAENGKNVGFSGERRSRESEKPKSGFTRSPTPGPRHVRKNTSVENVTTVTQPGVQGSTGGHYSYTEKTAEAEVTEGYRAVRHNNTTTTTTSSSKPVPKPRRTSSAGPANKALQPSARSAAIIDVPQVENNGAEITETVMHIYEWQGVYDNLAKNECVNENIQGNHSSKAPQSKPASAVSRPHSGSGDWDFTRPSSTADSLHRPMEMFSLSSEPVSRKQITSSPNESRSKKNPKGIPAKADILQRHHPARGGLKKKAINPTGKKKSSLSSSKSEAKQKDSSSKTTNGSGEKLCDHNVVKKSGRSSDSGKKGQKSKGTELLQTDKKERRAEKTSSKIQAISPNIDQVNGPSTKREVKKRERASRQNGFNINIPEKEKARPPMKKKLLNSVQPKQLSMPAINKQRSLSKKSPKQTRELSESVSVPVLNHSPSEVHQYVEKWLQTQISPDLVPYMERAAVEEPEPQTKVVFQIGGDSDSEAVDECQANTSGHTLLPSVQIDPTEQNKAIRMHRSSEALGPVESEPSPSTSNLVTTQATLKPVLQQLCSYIQYITTSKSFPNFTTQVISVFGSPSKVLLSFLSAMTLQETLKGAVAGESHRSGSTPEAMLVVESLQKISTIEDEVSQRSSLTDLQNRTSSEFKDCWRDFQVLRQLDVASEAGDIFADQRFGIKNIMEELNMPQDLREEILSMFQQTKGFYPEVEESTFMEKDTDTVEHEGQSEQLQNNSKLGLEGDIEFRGIDGEQEAEHDEVEQREEEFDEDNENKQEMLQRAENEELEETPDLDSNSMSVEEERGRDKVGEENIEDEKGEENVNEELLEVKNEEGELSEQSTSEQEHDEGQNETGKFAEGKAGGPPENSSGEMGFTDQDDEVQKGTPMAGEGDKISEQSIDGEEENPGEETGKLVIADADVSAVNTCALLHDYTQPQGSCEEDQDNHDNDDKVNANIEEDEAGSVRTLLNESQHEDEKGNGTDTAHGLRTDEREDEDDEEKRSLISHPVEISQELIDFVNSALQSSSLIFIYDSQGNVRIESDNTKVMHTKQKTFSKSKEDSMYGLKRLPSPSTSDLSDYRPETSESGGYKTQESTDIITESGDEYRDPTNGSEMSTRTAEVTNSNPSFEMKSEQKTEEAFSSSDSKGTKASKEDISYFSAAKAEPKVATDAAECNSNEGILIDEGRWLLKENHLIRKSPPALMGMYDDGDSLADSAPDNNSQDSDPHSLTDQNPLAVISSSELEEMAKPHSPKCTYYNMPHGSDSDPFLDDDSVKSLKRGSSNGKGKGFKVLPTSFKVSPTIDTSKKWLKKNGSLSSFASVEFKMPDSRVHPEGDTAAVPQARSPPGGAGRALQAQDSVDTLRVRCGQYCPIL